MHHIPVSHLSPVYQAVFDMEADPQIQRGEDKIIGVYLLCDEVLQEALVI